MVFKKCMSTLHDLTTVDATDDPQNAVESFWLSGTTVRYTLKSSPTIKRVIFNPFGADLAEMTADTSPPPEPAGASDDGGNSAADADNE